MDASSLDWDSTNAIGLPDLDDAHKELVDLYNRIVRACGNEPDVSIVRERIRTFLMYARWHFAEEEERMQWCHYPNYVDHSADHARLLQDAEDFVENIGNALQPQDSPAIASYFKYWLTRHMASKDADFKAYLKSGDHGIAAS